MYEFKVESKRKENRNKIYLCVFIIAVIINTFIDFLDFGIEKVSLLRKITSLLLYGIILYFGLQRKIWAEFLIKFLVWLNIILLIIIITVKIFE
jgi:hypothetical protein